MRRARRLALDLAALFAASLALFGLLELKPVSDRLPLRFKFAHPYYAVRSQYEADPELGYRRKPHSWWEVTYRGDFYHPRLPFPVEPITLRVVHDAEGHNNASPRTRADIVVLGDSFAYYGSGPDDTFGARLEAASGRSVRSLAVNGYGPPQYLILFRRYAPAIAPKVALLCFYEGNDAADMTWWAQWRESGRTSTVQGYLIRVVSGGFLERYVLAAVGTMKLLSNVFQLAASRPPEVAALDLAGRKAFATFYDGSEPRTPERLLETREWRDLESVLRDFKTEAARLGAAPVVVFIPTQEHVYGSLTTQASDPSWKERRAAELAAEGNREQALAALGARLSLRVLSLTPVFKAAAAKGAALYYPFDTHWNSAGREAAARFVAAQLGAERPPRHITPSSQK